MKTPDKIVEVLRTDKVQTSHYKWYYYFKEFKPRLVKLENKLYKIDNSYGMSVKGFVITTINNKIEGVNILGYHPNAAPLTNHFILPKYISYSEFNKKSYNLIIQRIELFDLDIKHFFNPTNNMKIKWWEGEDAH